MAELAPVAAALAALGRRELQVLAKEHGLRANAKSEELIASLLALHAPAAAAPAAEPQDGEDCAMEEDGAPGSGEPASGVPGFAAAQGEEADGVEGEDMGVLARRLSPLFGDAAKKASTLMLDSPVAGLVTATEALHVQQRRGGCGGGVAASPFPHAEGAAPAGPSWCACQSAITPRPRSRTWAGWSACRRGSTG